MKIPTNSAPHIWWNVLLKIAPISAALSLPASIKSTVTTSHDAKMALPPIQGANLNAAEMVAFVSGAVAWTWTKYQPTAGRLDHGPVHRPTTTIRTTNGIQANSNSLVDRP